MSFTQLNRQLRLGLALLASGAAFGLGGTAAAQTGFPVFREDPGSALSLHLKTLADSPRNMTALMGAAKAALALGDPQAAVTFYARAEEIAPRDGRIKAGIGSAFLAMEQPENALRFFEEARTLGTPEGDFAADRGLAYDLLGNPAQAQRDYQLAMRVHDSEELRRRLALSRAITGDRTGALAAIDDQLRRQDRAAWRVRAFVLALTGDAAGATEAVRAVMPQQAAAMQPFLTRLPALRPAERAMAVHLGHFPGDGSGLIASAPTYASMSPSVSPPITDAGRPNPVQPGFGSPPRASGSASLQPRPAQPDGQLARNSTSFPARPGSVPARGADPAPRVNQPGAPTQLARNEARLPTPLVADQPKPAQPRLERQRGTGSMAQDRVSGIYARAEQAPPAPKEAGAPQAVRPPASAPQSSGQQYAALRASPPPVPPIASAVSAAPLRVAPASPSASGSVATSQPASGALPAPVRTGAAQGPPVPSDLAAAVSPAIPLVTRPSIAPPVSSGAAIASAPVAGSGPVTNVPALAQAAPVTPTTNAAAPVTVASTPSAQAITPPASTPAKAPALVGGLASLAATIRALEPEQAEAKPPAPKPETARKPEPAKAELVKTKPAKAEPAKTEISKAPSRHWVQIASAPDSLVDGEYRRLKRKHAQLLSGREGYRAPMGKSNRVLVGPFETASSATEFVVRLRKSDLTAVTWTSADGQVLEEIKAK